MSSDERESLIVRLVDEVTDKACRAEGVCNLLVSHFIEDTDRLNDTHIVNALFVIRDHIQEMNNLVNAYSEA